MPTPGLSAEKARAAVDAFEATKTADNPEGSKAEAAKALGLHVNTFRSRLEKARDLIPIGTRLKATSTLHRFEDDDGNEHLQWVKTDADKERQLEMAREAVSEMARGLPKIKPSKPARKEYSDDLMVVIPWGDPHFGMYAWAEEAGDDFDVDIARADLCAAVDYLVRQAPPATECVIANLGDFFHADNLAGVTPQSGHSLDVDTRLQRVLRVGVAAVRQCIHTALKMHSKVHFVPVVGNHDPVLGMAMGVLLANVYENEPRVVIHDAPTLRHYIRHGKVMMGFVHGDKTKDRDLPGIMATERPEDWGQTRHRYFFRGHHHHDNRQEFNGCIVEQVRTLAAKDAYAAAGGWLSGRDMKLIVMHREYGEVARTTCGIDMLRAVA